MGRLQDFIFPAYDVRFIAINDDVDSAKGENDFAVFKNVFNDYYAKDTQPAIIDKGQWERVQELRKNKRRPAKTGRTSIFSGLLYCADCGAKLYFCTCKIHYIREQVLYRIVLETIRQTLSYVRMFRKDFKLEMLAQDEESRKAELAEKQKALSGAKKRMEDLDRIIPPI